MTHSVISRCNLYIIHTQAIYVFLYPNLWYGSTLTVRLRWTFRNPSAPTVCRKSLGRALEFEALALALVGVDNGERHRGLVGIGIVESVPESVALAEQLFAPDLVPVRLRIRRASNGVTALGATNGPSLISLSIHVHECGHAAI